jgi:putative FmdB family regulatory protein
MALYEYLCTDCDTDFETLVSYSRRDEVDCPECGSPRPRRKLSAFATSGTSKGVSSTFSGGCGSSSGFT